jgi:hypothetical protein
MLYFKFWLGVKFKKDINYTEVILKGIEQIEEAESNDGHLQSEVW